MKNSHMLSKHVAVILAKHHNKESYEKWQDRTLADYASGVLMVEEFEELYHQERLRRIDYLSSLYPSHLYPNKQAKVAVQFDGLATND